MSDEANFVRAIVFANVYAGYVFRFTPKQLEAQGFMWAAQHAHLAGLYYEQSFGIEETLSRAQARYRHGAQPGQEYMQPEAPPEAPPQARRSYRARPPSVPMAEPPPDYEVGGQGSDVQPPTEIVEGANPDREARILEQFEREVAAQGKRVLRKGEGLT